MNQNRSAEELGQYLDDLFGSPVLPQPEDADDPEAEIALELAHMPVPKISHEMRERILNHLQQAQQTQTMKKRILPFPKEDALRWAAVYAVFIILLSHVTVPFIAFGGLA